MRPAKFFLGLLLAAAVLITFLTRGRFYLYTLRRQDPRDWAIEDGLDESVSSTMKLALVFLTVFNSSPRM